MMKASVVVLSLLFFGANDCAIGAGKHDVVIDQRIVTTMFLPSSAMVAQEMVNTQADRKSTSRKAATWC